MSEIKFTENKNLLSAIKDPFEFKKITSLRIFSIQPFFDKIKFVGIVEFQNGNTGGSQRFERDNMDDVYLEVRAFVKQLSEKDDAAK